MRKVLKTIQILALLLALPAVAQAQSTTTTVAGGTTNSYIIPLQYMNAPYAQWSQSIYPASYLASLTGMQFTSFTYYLNYSGTVPDPGLYTVSLAITTNADLASGRDSTPTTQVFYGAPSISGNQLTFTFDQPFTYTGGNLLVHFDRQAGTTTTTEAIAFNSISLNNASRSGRNSASTIDYNTEGTYFPYLPSVTIVATEANATPADGIRYWVGTGSNEATFTLHFNNAVPPVSLVWGYRWDDPYDDYTVGMMMEEIADSDSRVSFDGLEYGFLNGYSYQDSTYSLTAPTGSNYAGLIVNDEVANYGANVQPLADGDAIAWMDADYDFFMGYINLGQTDTVYVVAPGSVVPPADTTQPADTTRPAPDTLCSVVQALPYTEDFSSYGTDQSVRPFEARAAIPACWSLIGNGRVRQGYDTTATASLYLGGVGFSTSVNSFGAVAANDAFVSLIGSQIYTGTAGNHIASMNFAGTRRFAVLPMFDHPLSQTVLTFDHRTSSTGARLVVGYIVDDTASFVGLDTIAADNHVLHHDTVRFASHASLPADARLTLLWDVTSSTSTTTGPAYRYCGIDNLKVEVASSAPADTTTPGPGTDPVDATIAAADILYWVGSGSNEAILIVSYAQPDTALAWGYRFSGTATAADMTTAIVAADPRLTVVGSPSAGGDIRFALESGDTLGLSPVGALGYNFWWTNINGRSAASGAATTLHDGDVFKYGDLNSATGWDFMYGYYMEEAWTTPVTPVSVPDTTTTPIDTTVAPVDATIAAADIRFWVGSGSNEAILAVNWVDTALAWGYRFSGAATVQDMLDDIAAADPRFSYLPGGYGLGDILYIDTAAGMTDTLRGPAASFWTSTNNGVMDFGMGQTLADGDFEKWAVGSTGVLVDSAWVDDYGGYWNYIYVYPTPITPVTVPDTASHTPGPGPDPEHGPFCGPVGSEGCDAIAADSSVFVAWATACTLERGPQDISQPNSPLVTYGTEASAVGPVSMGDNMNVVSLGDGGSATLTFATPIANGDGPDFAVFENSFNDFFLELAFVEVSSDGSRFVRFPATSLTQTETQIGSTGRVDATFINNLAGKYRSGYGTPFDLEELRDSAGINIDSITHVRIVDVVGSIDPQYGSYDAFGHLVNDPWPTVSYSSGFDLAGVGVIHEADTTSVRLGEVAEVITSVWPNPVADVLNVSSARPVEAVLYDLSGRRVGVYALPAGRSSLGLGSLPAGVYMLRAEGSVVKVVKQ